MFHTTLKTFRVFFVGSDECKIFWHSALRFLTILHTIQLTPPCFSHVFLAGCGDFAGKVWSLTFWLLDILLLLIGKECIFGALFPFHCPLFQWPRPPRCPLLGQLKCSCRTQLSIIRPEGFEQGLGRRGKQWGEIWDDILAFLASRGCSCGLLEQVFL